MCEEVDIGKAGRRIKYTFTMCRIVCFCGRKIQEYGALKQYKTQSMELEYEDKEIL